MLGIPNQAQFNTHRLHQLFASQPYNTHRVSFRFTTSFIHFSSVQSTRCQLFLCSPAAPLRLRSPCSCTAHSLRPFRLQLLRFSCIVQPPSYPPVGGKFTPAASYVAAIAIRSSWLYCQHLCGGSLSASVHSFLILSGGHLRLAEVIDNSVFGMDICCTLAFFLN